MNRYRVIRPALVRAQPHSFALVLKRLPQGEEFAGREVKGGTAARSNVWVERALGGYVHTERLERV